MTDDASVRLGPARTVVACTALLSGWACQSQPESEPAPATPAPERRTVIASILYERAEGPFAIGIGDVDGDGASEIVVSNRNLHRDSPDRENTVKLVSGRSGVELLRLTGGEGFGYRIARAGDVNGDERPDFMVTTGDTHDLFARQRQSVVAVYSVTGELLHQVRGYELGSWIGTVGDANDDERADFAYSDYSSGRLIVHLRSGADGAPIWTWPTSADGVQASSWNRGPASVDLDADGIDDLVFAGSTDGPAGGASALYVLSGRTGRCRRLASGVSVDPAAYQALAGLQDVDGDECADLIVGDSSSRRATIVSGRTGEIVHRLAPDRGDLEDDFGWAVTGLGDVDADGVPDAAVGAMHFHGFEGLAYVLVFSGRDGRRLARVDGSVEDGSHEIDLPGSPHAFGIAVEGLGDVTGDGYPDLLVGEDRYPNTGFSLADRIVVYALAPSP